MGNDAAPLVTVVMPVRNEAAYIERSLGAVLAQDYPEECQEVLIVDGMSTDGTPELVKCLLGDRAQSELLANPQLIASAALNVGIGQAQGQVIVRVDGHTIIEPDYVQRCVQTLAETAADCVGGLMRAEGETAFGQAVALATAHPFGIGDAQFHYATRGQQVDTVYLGAWPIEVLRQIGPFDLDVGCNEDDVYSARLRAAGKEIWLDPAIRSIYFCRSSVRALWRQYFRYGYWKVRAFQKVPGSARLRHWVPPLFALAVVGGLPAALLLPPLRLPYTAGLAVYALCNLVVSAALAARAGWEHLVRLPLAFVSLHLSYGLGYWAGVARFRLRRQRAEQHE